MRIIDKAVVLLGGVALAYIGVGLNVEWLAIFASAFSGVMAADIVIELYRNFKAGV